ncbi:MAG: GapR family DNA-binding domain-containing protein, partial [Pseudomonadota bacterium]|nr:GapR family DNA-binding domain-containing protein [Pseudomonadota bacterium]
MMADENFDSSGNVTADELRLLIERAERLEEEKKGISDDI